MNRIMAPFAAPTKVQGLQVKSRRVRGAVSFGGSNGLVCLRPLPFTRTGTGPAGGISPLGESYKVAARPPLKAPHSPVRAGARSFTVLSRQLA
jgi:hypothetical protein